MTSFKLVLRSFQFHFSSLVGALLGAAVGGAVLVGALIVGDSVRGSLREMALIRLGRIDLALDSGERLFTSGLGPELERKLQLPVLPALILPGIASRPDGAARANDVKVLGVPADFWRLAPVPSGVRELGEESVVLNRRLAEQLRVAAGDQLLLRVQKPSRLSQDAPLSPEEDFAVALRLTVAGVVEGEALGRFSLRSEPVPPYNAFVSLPALQTRAEAEEKANLLLVGLASESGSTGRGRATLEQASQALREQWDLADAALELTRLEEGGLELRSDRVFLDEPVSDASLAASPGAEGILTYFVNELRIEDHATPYSMVTGMGEPVVPPDMADDEILLNQWAADDLRAEVGDEVRLSYYVVGRMRKTEERSAVFRLRGIVPMSGPGADPELMPDFPGLTDAENCRDWDTGLPLDMDRIRDQDEAYWDEYRGTPKGFITLAAAQSLWTNRFGTLTAVRYPPRTDASGVRASILQSLEPAAVGLRFEPVREQALRASAQSQDFGGLFIGFSLFLIVAALLLMALLFLFGVEQRSQEAGVLLAVGLTPRQVRRLFLMEGAVLAVLGGVIGVAGGIAYARGMLWGLRTIWNQAVGAARLEYHAQPETLVIGAVSSMVVAVVTIILTLRKQIRRSAAELMAEGREERAARIDSGLRGRWTTGLGVATGLAALGLVGYGLWSGQTQNAGLFFGAGALFLTAGLAMAASALSLLQGTAADERVTWVGLGVRGLARRRKRTLATVGLLACGSFLVASIGVFRLEAVRDADQFASGTGGFELMAQSTLAVFSDLNDPSGRDDFGIEEGALSGAQLIPFRVRQGDEASCLNLNRAQQPRLLGVDPESLRGRFTFSRVMDELSDESGWDLLGHPLEDGAVPAIGDAASIQWAMGKKIGDTLDYLDGQGQVFRVRLVAGVANSILQGNLVIAEDEFVRRFPSESGYRMFLIDSEPERTDAVAETLSRALQDRGLEVVPTVRRLAEFNAVQNTYLNTFQVLGGLGLLLGSAGLGVVVLRNVLERRGELAVLGAVGFRPQALRRLVLTEHGTLLLAGLGWGILAAWVAVLPSILSPSARVPYRSLGLTLAAVWASGFLWTWLATRLALRGKLTAALRNE